MDGIKTTGITLFLTQLPSAKGLAFCFEEDGVLTPVAYVSEKMRKTAIEKWSKFVNLEA